FAGSAGLATLALELETVVAPAPAAAVAPMIRSCTTVSYTRRTTTIRAFCDTSPTERGLSRSWVASTTSSARNTASAMHAVATAPGPRVGRRGEVCGSDAIVAADRGGPAGRGAATGGGGERAGCRTAGGGGARAGRGPGRARRTAGAGGDRRGAARRASGDRGERSDRRVVPADKLCGQPAQRDREGGERRPDHRGGVEQQAALTKARSARCTRSDLAWSGLGDRLSRHGRCRHRGRRCWSGA